jgi:hypothetical protein
MIAPFGKKLATERYIFLLIILLAFFTKKINEKR